MISAELAKNDLTWLTHEVIVLAVISMKRKPKCTAEVIACVVKDWFDFFTTAFAVYGELLHYRPLRW